MAGPTFQDVLELTHGLQQDLQAAGVKLVTVRSWLAAQPAAVVEVAYVCPHDGFGFGTAARLAEHLANVHGEAA